MAGESPSTHARALFFRTFYKGSNEDPYKKETDMIKKILSTRVSAVAVILGMALAEFAHIYLDNQFPHIF